MKSLAILMLSAGIIISGVPVDAGAMGRACIASKRSKGNRALCRCIDKVAERDLTRADRKLAVKFFNDPHRAQVVRQSDRSTHEDFWKRYKKFGATIEQTCASYR